MFVLHRHLLLLIVFALVVGILGWVYFDRVSPQSIALQGAQIPSESIDDGPEILRASFSGAYDNFWILSVRQGGKASLLLRAGEEPEQLCEITVDAEKLERLRNTMAVNNFAELPEHLGLFLMHCAVCRIETIQGDHTKSVSIHSLSPISRFTPKELEGLKRATRIWIDVRSLINDPRAFDSGVTG